MATTYVARERESTDIPIDAVFRDGRFDLLPDVQGRDFFDIKFRRDRLTITAGKYIGLVPLNDRVFIQVEPKMPIANLLAILSAVNGEIVELKVLEREYRVANVAPPAVMGAIALAFIAALKQLEVTGLRKRYDPITAGESALKGQIQFNDSAQTFWGRGTQHAAVCTYFDLTSDIPENRLLRYACHVLLLHHRSTGAFVASIRSLAHFEEFFARSGARLEHPRSQPQPRSVADADPVYQRAIRLAELIVSSRGIELPSSGSDVALCSFLIDMETMFEDYVRHVLAARMPGVAVLDGNKVGARSLYDDRTQPLANPDVVIRKISYQVLIGEVKYKANENRDDIDQVLVYGLCYRAPVVVLILPAETLDDKGLREIGIVNSVRVCRYRFNLAAMDLDAEEQDFANAMGALLLPV